MREGSGVKIGIIVVLLMLFLKGCTKNTPKIIVGTEQVHSSKTIEKNNINIDNQEIKSDFDKYMQKKEKIKDIERIK